MKNDLLFGFTVDKENNRIHVKREFAANLNLVWDAWTKAEILDQWWAPKPYRMETKSLDFREGGTWLYAMVSPQDERHWCKADYKDIEAPRQLSWLDAFCDEDGNENSGKPRSLWTNVFSEKEGVTTVDVTLQHDTLAEMEALIAMGFKEGFAMGLGNLEEVLQRLMK